MTQVSKIWRTTKRRKNVSLKFIFCLKITLSLFFILYNKETMIFVFSVSTKITDAIGTLSSNSSSPKWKRSPEDEVNFGHHEVNFGLYKVYFGHNEVNFGLHEVNFGHHEVNFGHHEVNFGHHTVNFGHNEVNCGHHPQTPTH